MEIYPIAVPGGSDTQIQYNNGGLFGGDSSLTWDDSAAKALTIAGASVVGLNSAVFQPAADSTTFFQVKDKNGNNILIVDTVINRVDFEDNIYVKGNNVYFGNANDRLNYDESANTFRFYADGTADCTLVSSIFKTMLGKFYFGATDDYINYNDGDNYYSLFSDGWEFVRFDRNGYMTLTNRTHEDTDGGRESRLNFKGEQSGGEETTLARIEVSHDGVADDQKGKIVLSTNDGADDDTPTVRMTIDSAGAMDVVGAFTAGTIQADNGADYDGLLSGITNITIVGGVITAVS